MPWLFILLVVVVIFVLFTRAKLRSERFNKSKSLADNAAAAPEGKRFLPPIPKGFQIYAGRLEVAGVRHRRSEALQFANGSGQTLLLEREPENRHDPNAIKVIGLTGAVRHFVGYVPKDISEQIVGSGLFQVVQGRLEYIWRSRGGYVKIIFQIIGPKERMQDYDAFHLNKPAYAFQKDFLKHFGLQVPKGLTYGEACSLVAALRAKLEHEDKGLLDEWDAFTEISDQFDDPEFREDYDLKKISRTWLKEAVDDMKRSGETIRSLADDIDKVVERVIELKPDVERK